MKIKESFKVIQKNNIYYVLDDNGKVKKYKPWLGDMFSFLYDRIMEKSIFPKKFKGSISKHFDILKNEYQDFHGKVLLEIATGSGFSSKLLTRTSHIRALILAVDFLSRQSGNLKIVISMMLNSMWQLLVIYHLKMSLLM